MLCHTITNNATAPDNEQGSGGRVRNQKKELLHVADRY